MKSCCTATRTHFDRKRKDIDDQLISSRQTTSFRNMVLINGGDFVMGTNDKTGFPSDGEGPARTVSVSSFYMDQYAVTNEEFAQFVEETNYITDAEKYNWSFVFIHFLSKKVIQENPQRIPQTPWWVPVKGAYWKCPEGAGSSINGRMDHPVVHISWNDANAFCQWNGKRLPTEAEWEYASRGGLEQKVYPWGDDLIVDGKHRCNIWQGEFPVKNTKRDGYIGTCPVSTYEPNKYGLYNTSGNVWEWCEDWFTPTYHSTSSSLNPKGPSSGRGKTMKGGSYLCHKSYCNRYRVASRSSNTPDSSTGNIGFRCARDTE